MSKYLATLGVAIIFGVFTASGLFLKTQDDLLVKREDLAALTPESREAIVQRQRYIGAATAMLPWFAGAGTVVGIGMTLAGLIGWSRRQSVTDELEEINRDKGRTELRQLTESARAARVDREVEDIVDVPAEPSVGGQKDGNGETSVGPVVSSSRRGELRNRYVEVELAVAVAIEKALGPAYDLDIGVEIRKGSARHEVDLVATAPSLDRRYVFEVVYGGSTFVKNYRNRLKSALAEVAGSASLLGAAVVPVVVFVHEDSVPDEFMNRAIEEARRMAQIFQIRPVVVFISEQQLDGDIAPALRRALTSGIGGALATEL